MVTVNLEDRDAKIARGVLMAQVTEHSSRAFYFDETHQHKMAEDAADAAQALKRAALAIGEALECIPV